MTLILIIISLKKRKYKGGLSGKVKKLNYEKIIARFDIYCFVTLLCAQDIFFFLVNKIPLVSYFPFYIFFFIKKMH